MKCKNDIRQFRPTRWWSNVQALRADAGMSEVDLSRFLSKADNYINNAAKNLGSPNIADALMIAEAFDTTVEEIAFGVVGLEIRKAQLLEELRKLSEEIADAQKDAERREKES